MVYQIKNANSMWSLCWHLIWMWKMSSTVGPFRPYFPKMKSSISWLLIGGEDLRKIFGKSSESGSENGGFWLAVENRRPPSDDLMSKNSSKKAQSLTLWGPSDHIFRWRRHTHWLWIGGEDLRKIVGKRRQGFGNGRQGKRKKEGNGGWGKARKKEGRGGWGKDKKKQGGVGGWWRHQKKIKKLKN